MIRYWISAHDGRFAATYCALCGLPVAPHRVVGSPLELGADIVDAANQRRVAMLCNACLANDDERAWAVVDWIAEEPA